MRYKLIKGGLLKKNKLPIFVIQKIGSYMSCLADSNKFHYEGVLLYSTTGKTAYAEYIIFYPKLEKGRR